MTTDTQYKIPSDGFAGLRANWKLDISSGFSVFLLSIPFCLGAAFVSGFPIGSGLVTCVVAGILVTFLSGSHLTIKGPTTALAIILFFAVHGLSPHPETGLRYAVVVVILSGFIQVLFGVFKIDKLRTMIPDAAIFGVLAAVGLSVFIQQLPYFLGIPILEYESNIFFMIIHIAENIMDLRNDVFFVGVFSLILLFSFFSFDYRLTRVAPTPFIVLLFGILAGWYLDWSEVENMNLFLTAPQKLTDFIHIPNFYTDFNKIFSITTIQYAFILAIIGSLESLLNDKSIDAIDIYRRRTKSRRELIALGLGNMVCGFLGALPMISTMLRSASNINNNAKTRWANFFQGVFMLGFTVLLFSYINLIPKVSLAVILIHTAYRLNAPKLIRDIFTIGREQLVIFIVTVLISLLTNFLIGLAAGIITSFAVYFRLGVSFKSFFFFKEKEVRIINFGSGDRTTIKLRAPALASNYNSLEKVLKDIPQGNQIYIDFSRSEVVDHGFMEWVHYHSYNYSQDGGGIELQGLDNHDALSDYPLATRKRKKKKAFYEEHLSKLSERQIDLLGVASINNSKLRTDLTYDGNKLQGFPFSLGYEIKYRENKFRKKYEEAYIEFSDIFLSRGIRMSEQSFKMSIVLISNLNVDIPEFTLEKEGLFDRFYQTIGYDDIDFDEFPEFSESFFLTGPSEEKIRQFFKPELIELLNKHKEFNVETYNNQILIFEDKELLNKVLLEDAIDFCEKLIDVIYGIKRQEETQEEEIPYRF